MHLPEGVTHNPGVVQHWIGLDTQAALLTIDTSCAANNQYQVQHSDFDQDLQRLFSQDYRDFDRRYHLVADRGNR